MSVKYDDVYLHNYQAVASARQGLAGYFHFYNTARLHESLTHQIPYEIYLKKEGINILMQASAIHLNSSHFLSRQWGVSQCHA